MGEVTSYTKEAIDALVFGGGGGGGGDVTQQELDDGLALKTDLTLHNALDDEVGNLSALVAATIPLAQKQAPNGVAALNGSGKIYDSQLPLLSATLVKIEAANVALGVIAGMSAFVWTEITEVVKRGLMSKIIVTPSAPAGPDTLFDVELRDAAGGGGEMFLQALGIPNNPYESYAPIYIEGDDTTRSIWVGVKNQSQWAATFTLTALRVERYA